MGDWNLLCRARWPNAANLALGKMYSGRLLPRHGEPGQVAKKVEILARAARNSDADSARGPLIRNVGRCHLWHGHPARDCGLISMMGGLNAACLWVGSIEVFGATFTFFISYKIHKLSLSSTKNSRYSEFNPWRSLSLFNPFAIGS